MVIIAGPNGAGKSTLAAQIYKEIADLKEFVNADSIASGLSPYNADNNTIEAGKIMLKRINGLITNGSAFGFESTLAGKMWKRYITAAQRRGFDVYCCFIMLNDPDLAVLRVRERVKKGGHSIPEQVIRRRFSIGSINFWNTYRSICDHWVLFDNSGIAVKKVAEGSNDKTAIIRKGEFEIWQRLVKK